MTLRRVDSCLASGSIEPVPSMPSSIWPLAQFLRCHYSFFLSFIFLLVSSCQWNETRKQSKGEEEDPNCIINGRRVRIVIRATSYSRSIRSIAYVSVMTLSSTALSSPLKMATDESSRDEGKREDLTSVIWFECHLVHLELDWNTYLVDTQSEAAPACNFKQVSNACE